MLISIYSIIVFISIIIFRQKKGLVFVHQYFAGESLESEFRMHLNLNGSDGKKHFIYVILVSGQNFLRQVVGGLGIMTSVFLYFLSPGYGPASLLSVCLSV